MTQPQRRRIGRPPLSGPEAESNPLHDLTHEERRTLFLETAARLFGRNGYANTSVGDIAAELGFTKGVYYYYWSTKREIVEEIHNRALQILHDRLSSVIDSGAAPREQLETAIANHVETVMQDHAIIGAILADLDMSSETIASHRQYARRFQDLVERGIAAGVVRDDLDPQMLTLAIIGLCNSVSRWYRAEGRLSATQVRDLFGAFAAGGWVASGSRATAPMREGER
jgi:AcrR family transcriptional regulator